MDGTLKAVFASITEAAEYLNCSEAAIRNACCGITKSSHGYLWRFADDELDLQLVNNKTRIRDRRVVQYTLDGKRIATFNNAHEAANYMNVTYNSIYNACIGKSKSSCGFIWKFETEEYERGV